MRNGSTRPSHLHNSRAMQQSVPHKPSLIRRANNISERRVFHQQATTTEFDRLAAPSRPAADPVPRTRRRAACHGPFPAAEAALGCRELHLLCRWVNSIAKCRGVMGGNKQSSSRSSGNRCDSSLRALRDCFARSIYPRNRQGMPH